jgi:hypothetical protein
MPTHVYVTAAEGRECPIPSNEATAPGGSLLRVLPGKRYRLPWSQYTRKRVRSGDLVLVNAGGTPVGDPEQAAAPRALEHVDETGAMAPAPAQTMQSGIEATTNAPLVETLTQGKR